MINKCFLCRVNNLFVPLLVVPPRGLLLTPWSRMMLPMPNLLGVVLLVGCSVSASDSNCCCSCSGF